MVWSRNHAQFERARWLKRLLFPMWTVQVVVLLGLMGLFGYRLAVTADSFDDEDKKGHFPMVEVVWECANVGFSLLSLVLTLIEIAKLIAETLTPFFMLASHILKLTCSFIILGLDITVYIRRSEGHWSIIGLALDCGLLFAMLVLFIYAVTTFRRLSKYDDYHHPANAKGFGYNNQLEMGNGISIQASPNNSLSTEYFSQSRPRSVSASSFTPSLSSLHRKSSGSVMTIEPLLVRRESYNHKRDTQFDEYVSRRASVSLKDDVDRALGQEFWGAANARNSIERSDSVVGSGSVPSARVQRPRGDSLGHTKSWASDQGLVAVPESIEEDHHDNDAHSQHSGKARAASADDADDDRQLLLAPRESVDLGAGPLQRPQAPSTVL